MSAQDLPVDILLPIFHLCLEGPFPPSDDPLRSARSLSQVCTSWRRTFLSDMRWQAIGEAGTTALIDGRERRMSITHLVQGERRPFDPLDILLPWSCIASIDLHSFPVHPRIALRFFHHTSRTLIEVCFQVDAKAPFAPSGASALPEAFPILGITLRRLTKVHLIILDDANGSEDELRDLFTLAHPPKLKHLRIEAVSELSTWRLHLLSSIRPWCSHHIERLDLIHSSSLPASTIHRRSSSTTHTHTNAVPPSSHTPRHRAPLPLHPQHPLPAPAALRPPPYTNAQEASRRPPPAFASSRAGHE